MRKSIYLGALVALALASPAQADIVYNTGGTLGGDIYAMEDDGSGARLLAGGDYEKPHVALDGTVLFSDDFSIMFEQGAVHAYKDGVARVLADDFSGAPDDIEAGFGGRYLFFQDTPYGGEERDTLRQGRLDAATTSALAGCVTDEPFGPDPEHSNASGYWEGGGPGEDPTVSPVRDEFVVAGCFYRRHWDDDTVAPESIPGMTLVRAGADPSWILRGESNWSFSDPSFSPDGEHLVFIYWRGYDSKGLEREAGEGIWVADADGTQPRQVFTLYNGQLAQRQNIFSPRLTGDGRIVFGFNDWIEEPDEYDLYTVPASCDKCSMADATLLKIDATEPAWTPLNIEAPPTPTPTPTPSPSPTPTPSPTPPPDTTPPGLTLGGKATQKAAKTIGIVVRATTEDLWATATGRISITRVSKRYTLSAIRDRFVAGGRQSTLKLRLSKAAQTQVRRALRRRRRVTAQVTVSARDAARNTTTRSLTIRLRK